MANKTKAEPTSVEACLDARATPAQRPDCDVLVALMHKATGEPPVMWGPSIVGFGRYRYTYDSGRSGEAPVIGFAVRGRELVLYLMGEEHRGWQALLDRLGPHRKGAACLYVKRLADLDLVVLGKMVATSIAEVERRHARVRAGEAVAGAPEP